MPLIPEQKRLKEDNLRTKNWKRWGTYLSDRQWGTVREDYSPDGACWSYLSHDQSRSRAYRWGEDGILGWTDRQCRLCVAPALWNGVDPILKERLFGLTGPEGNHGEDVKELYYYLDATPTHSYAKGLYKYPHAEYPYQKIVEENKKRGITGLEYELMDTGIFDENRYFDLYVEYAKGSPNDCLIRYTAINRGPEVATLQIIPQLWFRNTWDWTYTYAEDNNKPSISLVEPGKLEIKHTTLGTYYCFFETKKCTKALFTDNQSNPAHFPDLTHDASSSYKDAFHEFIVQKNEKSVFTESKGTKCGLVYSLKLQPDEEVVVRLRLVSADETPKVIFGRSVFDETILQRKKEADEFYNLVEAKKKKGNKRELSMEERRVVRQASASLLWTKQFYHYVVNDWLNGEKKLPSTPQRSKARNTEWRHLFSRDILSMPDKWEYPWFAAWDSAFHMIPFSLLDPDFTKEQLILFLREWYLHPNGQIPAYEFAFSDVNPPVHAWSVFRVYKMTAERGSRDRAFLESAYQKLLLNFTWWVNRKDPEGNNLFSGGFLGMDNIGVFDRSRPLPTGGYLQQADGTAWMAFYCLTMLSISLELAKTNPVYEDMASKFFEHFVGIADSINNFNGYGLWDDQDGFYYDQLRLDGQATPLKTRSLVGLLPLIAVEVLEDKLLERFPNFSKRLKWFVENRSDLLTSSMFANTEGADGRRALAIPTRERLERLLRYMLDENEFLSPYGLRSVSKVHKDAPYSFKCAEEEYSVGYVPGEGNSYAFGGNSNWRGPIWFPINFLIIEALERYHHFFGESFKVEYPTRSGNFLSLKDIAAELSKRLSGLFLHGATPPAMNDFERFSSEEGFKNLLLFPEYFDGDTGRGLGAMHQTGWTALIINFVFGSLSRSRA